MEEQEKKIAVELDEEPKPEPCTPKEAKAMARVENLLGSVQSGWKISIIREQPSWCRGHLETYEVYNPEENEIDIDYLIRMWGGHRLYIKIHGDRGRWIGGGSVSLFSFPPKVRGKELAEPGFHSESDQHPPAAGYPPNPYYPVPQPAPQMDLTKILDMVNKAKGSDLGTLIKVLDLAQQRQQPVQPMGNMPEQMLGMLNLFREMKTAFGDLGGGGETPAEQDNLMPIIGEMVKAFAAKKEAPIPARGALAPPRRRPTIQSAPLPPAQPVAESTAETLPQIADKLASLGPEDAAEVLITAMGNMPEDKREKAMQAFFANMVEEDVLDDSSNTDNNTYQDNDDPSSYPDRDAP